jgi:DNA-binding NtrC family response regulator
VLEDRKVLRVGGRVPHSVDVRFLSATNRDVEHDSAQGGSFRQDLFFRLCGFTISVPPLRERRADIPPLVQEFIRASCRSMQRTALPTPSAEALQLLQAYTWPGNIRELRNVIERAVLLCDGPQIAAAHLPPKLASGVQQVRDNSEPEAGHGLADPRERLLDQLEQLDRQRIVEVLAKCAGNQTQAAEQLGISRRTLVSRLQSYDLPRPRKR